MSDFLDTRGFAAFIDALVEMSGTSRREVLLQQAGALLDLCIQRSPNPFKRLGKPGTLKKVAARITKPGRYIGDSGSLVSTSDHRVPRPVPLSTLQTLTGSRGGTIGGEWYVGANRAGKKIFLPPQRMLGNEKFHRRQNMKFSLYQVLEPKVKIAQESVGAVAASWVSIAEKIGAPLRKAPAWVKKVRRRIEDGTKSHVEISDVGSFIELVNTNTQLISRYDGARILQGAIDTRLKAFEGDIRRDVFADITARAQRYPGIFTT